MKGHEDFFFNDGTVLYLDYSRIHRIEMFEFVKVHRTV